MNMRSDVHAESHYQSLSLARQRLADAEGRRDQAKSPTERAFYARAVASEQKQVNDIRELLGVNAPMSEEEETCLCRELGIDI